MGRVGVDGVGDGAETEAGGHRQRQLADELTRVFADNGRADDAIAALAHVHPHESRRGAVDDGAVHMIEGLLEGVDGDSARCGFSRGQPDLRQLGLGICDARNEQAVDAGPAEE